MKRFFDKLARFGEALVLPVSGDELMLRELTRIHSKDCGRQY